MQIQIVTHDPVTRVLATRLIERLGHPAPLVTDRLVDVTAACDALLLDADADLDAAPELLRIEPRPRLIWMSARDAAAPFAVDASLRKPLTLDSLAAALSASTATGDFNKAAWDELLQLFGARGLHEMVGALQRDLPQQQQRLATALREQDSNTIRRIAHSLRGVTLQFGAQDLADRCSEVELSATGAEPLLDRYAVFVRQLTEALHER